MLTEDLLSKGDSEISNELKDGHSNSPLFVLGQVLEKDHHIFAEEVLTDNDGNSVNVVYHIQLNFRVVIF